MSPSDHAALTLLMVLYGGMAFFFFAAAWWALVLRRFVFVFVFLLMSVPCLWLALAFLHYAGGGQ